MTEWIMNSVYMNSSNTNMKNIVDSVYIFNDRFEHYEY
jgi:hypothetical protein